MHQFKELKIWQKSRELAKSVYQESQKFPSDEIYGLTSQIRRAVISVSANIAEGTGRGTEKEFARFLNIANGSAYELESLLLICLDLNYLPQEAIKPLLDQLSEIQRMIFSLKQKLSSKI